MITIQLLLVFSIPSKTLIQLIMDKVLLIITHGMLQLIHKQLLLQMENVVKTDMLEL
jgi:hypothetical protein